MPDVNNLLSKLPEYGYECIDANVVSGKLHCRIEGDVLGDISPLLRATSDVCNIGVAIGLVTAVLPRLRYTLMLDLLELNFENPLARMSIFRASTGDKEDAYMSIIVAETSFFWTEPTKAKFDGRMKALHSIAFDASKLLSAKHALGNVNPFYQRLKSGMPPVERVDFPEIGHDAPR